MESSGVAENTLWIESVKVYMCVCRKEREEESKERID
jgi:hypothetical protein